MQYECMKHIRITIKNHDKHVETLNIMQCTKSQIRPKLAELTISTKLLCNCSLTCNNYLYSMQMHEIYFKH